MLVAVLMGSLHIEENCSLSLPLPRQVLNGGLILSLGWQALPRAMQALPCGAGRSTDPRLCRSPVLSLISLKANATIARI